MFPREPGIFGDALPFHVVDDRHDGSQDGRSGLGHAEIIADYMHVSQLVPLDQKLISIPYEGRVRDALDLMQQNAFNQLPVEADDGSIVGLFSYRSLANHISKFRPSDDLLSKLVGDMSDDPYFAAPTQNLNSVIEKINTDGAILIGTERDVYAVATTHDLSDLMWSIAQPFMLIGDIETKLRRMMNSVCPTEEMSEIISRSYASESNKSQSSLDELSLGELLGVLKNGTNFGRYFRSRFTDMNYTSQTLDPVVPIRNRMFHFRGQVSDEDLEILRVAGGWLNRKWRAKRE